MSILAENPLVDSLDRLRRLALGLVVPIAPRWFTSRERRVFLIAISLIATSFLLTAAVPLWVLALGPIVWGIPHVVSDVRYLVVRQGLHRRWFFLLLVACGCIAAGLGLGLRGGVLAAAGAVLVARASWMRRAGGLIILAALYLAVYEAGWKADWFFLHAHNFVALGLWLAWRGRQGAFHWGVTAIVLLLSGFIVMGGLDGLQTVTLFSSTPSTTIEWGYFERALVPQLDGPLATRLILLFAFMQSVHYVIWVRLVPEEDRPRETSRSWRQSLRALQRDMGLPVLLVTGLGMLVLAAFAFHHLADAREHYLDFAFFHGYLELAVGALWFCEGRRAVDDRA